MIVLTEQMESPLVKVSMSDIEASSDTIEESGMTDEQSDTSSDESKDENEDSNTLTINEGWADSVAKILGSNKPKNKKTLVLSRAKKYSDILKKKEEEKPLFEVVGSEKNDNIDVKEQISTNKLNKLPIKKQKQEKSTVRCKPNILEKDREKLLNKIATKGVVQLFNAVRNQQKSFEKEIDQNNLSETKKEKIYKKFDKRAFLDTLMGQTKSIIVDEEAKSLKSELKVEDKPKWNALRDDFMTGAKMKDWDKESIDE